MLKRYCSTDMEWNTETARWERPNYILKEIPVIKEKIETYAWKSWTEFLYQTFKSSRLSPNWDHLKDCYDEQDQEYFEMLEKYYKGGLISPELIHAKV